MEWIEFLQALLVVVAIGVFGRAAGLSPHDATTYALLIVIFVRLFSKDD